MLLLAIFACQSTPSPDTTGAEGQPTADTAALDTTAATGDTATSTGSTATGATADTGPTLGPVDCKAPTLPVVLPNVPSPGDPIPFEPRPDGTFWFAQGFVGLSTGMHPDSAVLVHPERADAVRTMPNGEVLWLTDAGGPATVYRDVAGVATVWATLPANPRYGWGDLQPHPSGSLIVAAPIGSQWVDATGGHVEQFDTAGPSAYSADGTSLWALDASFETGQYGLHSFPVDVDGRPDWTQGVYVAPTPPITLGILPPIFIDLEVDGCDRVYLFLKPDALSFGNEQLWVFTPTAGAWDLIGEMPQEYGRSYPRIGRAPGQEQHLIIRATYPDRWARWHLGTGAAVP